MTRISQCGHGTGCSMFATRTLAINPWRLLRRHWGTPPSRSAQIPRNQTERGDSNPEGPKGPYRSSIPVRLTGIRRGLEGLNRVPHARRVPNHVPNSAILRRTQSTRRTSNAPRSARIACRQGIRNEGVRGSSPRVGSPSIKAPVFAAFLCPHTGGVGPVRRHFLDRGRRGRKRVLVGLAAVRGLGLHWAGAVRRYIRCGARSSCVQVVGVGDVGPGACDARRRRAG